MTQATTDPLILAAEEADAEAAAADAEAVAAQASATAARARARAARLRREAGSVGEPPGSRASGEAKPVAESLSKTSDHASPETGPAVDPAPPTTADPGASGDAVSDPDLATDPDSDSVTDAGLALVTDAGSGSASDANSTPDAEPAEDKPRVRLGKLVRGRPLPTIRRPRGRTLGRVLAALVVVAALVVGGFSMWNHHEVGVQQAREDEYLNAAREGVIALTSMDSSRAADDVQRVLDHSTGAFRTDFQTRAEDFAKVVEQSKVATQGEITASAVESMTDESAVVLVSAASRITNSAGAQQEPRAWRLSVTVTRDGSELKMSKVEFVP
ncbi:hypothetical protein [Nocardia sp. NBC_00416]|uniref:hypothetical protein n=1 Tax=Nocardia sp. NBC_00416 TaxID=2975991 RepID=UPI002E1FAF40